MSIMTGLTTNITKTEVDDTEKDKKTEHEGE